MALKDACRQTSQSAQNIVGMFGRRTLVGVVLASRTSVVKVRPGVGHIAYDRFGERVEAGKGLLCVWPNQPELF